MDSQEKSFDLVQESSRLLVTLATGFIAFSVTFSTELDGFGLVTCWEKWTWSLSWVSMLVSVACGVWTLLGLTTVLVPSTQTQEYNPTIRDNKVRVPFGIQIIAFGISAMFMVLYGLGEIFS